MHKLKFGSKEQILSHRANDHNEIVERDDMLTTTDLPKDSDPFLRYINNRLKENILEPSTPCRRYAGHAVKAGTIAFGAVSGLPYINVARTFAGSNQALGWFLGYGVFTSITVVTAWALFDVLDSALGKTKEEKEITSAKKSCYRETIYWIAVPLLGFSAAFPISYLLFSYNNQSFFYGGSALFTDLISNSCSLNRFFTNLKNELSLYCAPSKNKKLQQVRILLIRQLAKSAEILPTISHDKLNDLITYAISDNAQTQKDFLYRLLEVSKSQIITEEQHATLFAGFPTKLVKLAGLLLPVAGTVFVVINSYDTLNLITPNEIFRWTVASLTTLPYTIFEVMLAGAVLMKLYQLLVQLSVGTYNKSVAEIFFPKSYCFVTVLGLITAFSAFAPRAQFIKDKFEYNKDLALALGINVCISAIAYKSSAMLSIIKMAFQKYSSNYGQTNVKQISKVVETVNRLIYLIHDTSPEKLQAFIDNINFPQILSGVPENGQLHKALIEYSAELSKRPRNEVSPLLTKSKFSALRSDTEEDDQPTANKWYSFWKNRRKVAVSNTPDVEEKKAHFCVMM